MAVKISFYVYALFRPDTGCPFYIGKGHGRRIDHHEEPKRRDNNPHKKHIILQAKRNGLEIPKVKLVTGLSEDDAFIAERAFIAALGREPNGPLVNATDGGEGRSGAIVSEITRKKMSASKAGHQFSDETKKKISVALTGRKHSEATLEKLRKARKNRGGTFIGHNHSDETKSRWSAIRKGRRITSPEILANMSAAQKAIGNKPPSNKGKKHTAQHSARISAALTGKILSEETKRKISETKKRQYLECQSRSPRTTPQKCFRRSKT